MVFKQALLGIFHKMKSYKMFLPSGYLLGYHAKTLKLFKK